MTQCHVSSSLRLARQAGRAGSTMLVALLTVAILSLVAANVLSSISVRYGSANRSGSWNDALLAANAGVDVTLASLTSIIPNVSVTPTTGISAGYTPITQLPSLASLQVAPNGLLSLPSNLLTNGVPLLTINPLSLTHGGEGGLTQQSSVTLELTSVKGLLGSGLTTTLGGILGGDPQLLRLTSTGTVAMSGGRTAGMSRLDNELWRPSIVTDRLTGAALTVPTVARRVQVVLRLVRPYEAAVVSGDALLASDKNTVFDSFNSTLGPYDSLKHLSNGSVRANGANVVLGGTVYGNAGTNGGNLAKDGHVTGTVSNAAYTPLPYITPPTWNGNNPSAPSSVTGNTSLPSVVLLNLVTALPAPAQYRFTGVSGNLTITGIPGTSAEIYIDGDLTGGITVAAGVTLKVYVSGSINTNTSKLKNGSNVASNLQIYGVIKDPNANPTIRLNADAALAAAIYAPGHQISVNGNADLSGSITGARFEATGGLRVHYDEALAYNVGPLLRYGVASWKELTTNPN